MKKNMVNIEGYKDEEYITRFNTFKDQIQYAVETCFEKDCNRVIITRIKDRKIDGNEIDEIILG